MYIIYIIYIYIIYVYNIYIIYIYNIERAGERRETHKRTRRWSTRKPKESSLLYYLKRKKRKAMPV